MIVFLTYAIIQPLTVVVEATDAAIAHAAVLRLVGDHSFTDRADELQLIVVIHPIDTKKRIRVLMWYTYSCFWHKRYSKMAGSVGSTLVALMV